MQIISTQEFARMAKKIYKNQKLDLDNAVKKIRENPCIGDQKKGDLSQVFVYKFKMQKQLTLISYMYDNNRIILTLLSFGSHENFYKKLKIQLNG